MKVHNSRLAKYQSIEELPVDVSTYHRPLGISPVGYGCQATATQGKKVCVDSLPTWINLGHDKGRDFHLTKRTSTHEEQLLSKIVYTPIRPLLVASSGIPEHWVHPLKRLRRPHTLYHFRRRNSDGKCNRLGLGQGRVQWLELR